jgi:Ca-activated chloride channel family protein
MKGEWQGTSKFELSKQIIIHTVDSISKLNSRVEFALRVFGHQFPRAANNCNDTKLEVSFSRNNLSELEKRLNTIRPQGQTLISFTLLQCIADFPADSASNNSIVLITDGVETCPDDICSITSKMEAKGIILKPFIVGLGLPDTLKKKFECAGLFYDVQNEDMFSNVMRVVISRALNATTSQINLLDIYGMPTETNTAITFYDHSGREKYQIIHTMNSSGNPDTILLDPKLKYDLVVHSIPPVSKNNLELIPGIHNTIAVEVPQGTLELKLEAPLAGYPGVSALIRKSAEDAILFVQDMNRMQKYLVGSYDLEILTLPPIIMKGVQINEAVTTSIKIPRAGLLSLSTSEAGLASIFRNNGESLEKIFDMNRMASSKSINLQPGSYTLIFRPEKGKQSAKTKQYPVKITSGKTTSLRL